MNWRCTSPSGRVAGSACKTGNPKPSAVLEALGLDEEWTKGGLRFTVGSQNTAADIEYVIISHGHGDHVAGPGADPGHHRPLAAHDVDPGLAGMGQPAGERTAIEVLGDPAPHVLGNGHGHDRAAYTTPAAAARPTGYPCPVTDPLWKDLVERLKESGFRSKYRDHLFERARVKGYLEAELLSEMASSLRRSEDKVNLALLELELAEQKIDEAPTPAQRRQRIREYNQRRDHAYKMRWEFLIHREALGMRRHDKIEALYPVPPPRKVE